MSVYKELNRGNLPLTAQAFRSPGSAFGPCYTWDWNSEITKEGIDRALDDMERAGVRCFYVLPFPLAFRINRLRTALRPPYLSEAYFELLRHTWTQAKRRGMAVWMYDEGGFPSGSLAGKVAARDPETIRRSLEARAFYLPAGMPYRRCGDVVAARLAQDNSRVEAGDTFGRDVTLTEYYADPAYDPASAFSPAGLLEPETTRLFLEMMHEEHYKRLGDYMGEDAEILFTDEPTPTARPWPRGMEALFFERFGYDLLDHLPALFPENTLMDESERQACLDYKTLVGELFRARFLEPVRAWCREHGMIFAGHLDNEHRTTGGATHGYGSFLQTLRGLDIPGVDVIWRQIPAPDNQFRPDVCNTFFPRLASSAARQNGGNLAMSESFAIYGAGLTGGQMRYVINYQAVRGVNLFNFMSIQSGRDRMSGVSMRPCFTPEMPGYEHLRAINDYTRRLSRLLQSGTACADAALYIPARDFLAGKAAEQAATRAYEALGKGLEAQGIDFDLIDDEAILHAERTDGALRIGSAVYRRVYVPECRYMPQAVREKLEALPPFEPEPTVITESEALRAHKRALPCGGALYFLYNESGEALDTGVRFRESLPVYLPDLTDGGVFIPEAAVDGEGTVLRIRLESGEAAAVWFMGEPVEGARPVMLPDKTWTIEAFEIAKTASFGIDMAGVFRTSHAPEYKPAALGSWAQYFGGDFSGEAVYRAEVDLGEDFDPAACYELDLGRAAYSAKVSVNGTVAGVVSADPMRLRFGGGLLAGPRFTLEIEAANTASNQIARFEHFDKWPVHEVGPYHQKTLEMERETMDGGLYGPVTLARLKGQMYA